MPRFQHVKTVASGIFAGAVVAAGCSMVSAMAQQDQMPGRGPGAGLAHEEQHSPQFCTDIDAHEAAVLAYAKVKLKITDAEAGAWTQFEDKAKAATAPIRQSCQDMQGKPMPKTLPDRLARMDELATAHANALHQIRPAVDQLYAQLTPDQKEEANHLLAHVLEGPGTFRHHHEEGPGGMHRPWGPGPHGDEQGPPQRPLQP